jgi:CRP/FNR family transcriptional regulator
MSQKVACRHFAQEQESIMPSIQCEHAENETSTTSSTQSREQLPNVLDTATSHAENSPQSLYVAETCLPLDLNRLDAILSTTRRVKRGEVLYRTNDHFKSFYTVRAGCFKTVVTHRDGGEQVTGFQLKGETLGLDGVFAERHNCDAVALEDSEASVTSFALLVSMCREVGWMQHRLLRMMSGEIVRGSGLLIMLGTMSAEQRVAAFLLDISDRMKAQGYSPNEFNLRMTRQEMGSYLGIKLETMSRMFSKLRSRGLVHIEGKGIRIVDRLGLSRI